MPVPYPYDYKNPDWRAVMAYRVELLQRIRRNPGCLPALRAFYRDNPAQFAIDWGMTFDPRNVEIGLPSAMPFVLFPKQEDAMQWMHERWKARENGLLEKTRDAGFSWVALAWGVSQCLFNPGVVIGYGSRKAEYVDKIGDPKSLFWKARFFIDSLPVEFKGDWGLDDAPHMRINFPATGSSMIGEAGDNIGRGNRTSAYIVDESAHLERQELVDASLAATTNCRIDGSSPNGPSNSFAWKKNHYPAHCVFTFRWQDDPRKDQAWYDGLPAKLAPLVIAQEVDLNYTATSENSVILSAWVQAAIGACEKLGITPTGKRTGALDPADEGSDDVAFLGATGVHIDVLTQWSGKGSDLFQTADRAFSLCDEHGIDGFTFDSDGLGASIRGDAKVINERRRAQGVKQLSVSAFRGSEAVFDPEGEMVPGRKNKDFFKNAKAQAWWRLRILFENTYKAVEKGLPFDPDEIISIDPNLPLRNQLMGELCQPVYSINTTGKVVVDKAPNGTKSPNLADTVMIRYQPGNDPLAIWERLAEAS